MGDVKVYTQEEVFKKYAEKLVGCRVELDPKSSGMFVDDRNKITLHFFDDSHSGLDFKAGMDPVVIVKGIKAGLLRVIKDKKDVTVEYGGKDNIQNWKRQPIVENSPKPVDKDKDKPLLAVLGRNKEQEILGYINALTDFSLLHRLRELEAMGKNPSFAARGNILDALDAQISKTTSGISEVREIKEAKEDIVSTR